MKKILLIYGHPSKESFNSALLKSYKRGLEGKDVDVAELFLTDLNLEKVLFNAHNQKNDQSTEIKFVQQKINEADLLVIAYPIWWGTPPAILKLFIENVFVSGFAYKYTKPKFKLLPTWEKRLRGKKARLIVTFDSPKWYYLFWIGDPNYKMMKKSILNFSGIKIIGKHYFGSIVFSNEKKRKKMLQKMYNLGCNEK